MTYYSLQVAGREIGVYSQDNIREAVEALANGKPWGWRNSPAGMEAVCEHAVIALAVPLEV